MHDFEEGHDELSGESVFIFRKGEVVGIEYGLFVAVEHHEPEGFFPAMVLVLPFEVDRGG